MPLPRRPGVSVGRLGRRSKTRRENLHEPYDQAARFVAKADPDALCAGLLRGRGLELRFREWLDVRPLSLPGGGDRTADAVARLDAPAAPERPWLVVFEFQTRPDPAKLDVTLEEVAILRARERHGPDGTGRYLVTAAVINLTARPLVAALDMTWPDGTGTRHAPPTWDVFEASASEAVAEVEAGLSPWGTLLWVPLMHGADDLGLIERWRPSFMARAMPDRARSELIRAILFLAEAAGVRKHWRRIMEGIELTESELLNEWIAEAVAKKTRTPVDLTIRARFPGPDSGPVLRTIQEQDDPDILEDWFKAALRVPSLNDFVQHLRG